MKQLNVNDMKSNELREMNESIKNASSLELVAVLQKAELRDAKETRAVVDEIYEQFKNSGSLVDEIVVPIFMSIADGFLESTSATRKLRKKGLTASRLINECKAFSYEQPGSNGSLPDGYTEWKNASEQTKADFKNYGKNERQPYSRAAYEERSKLNVYKEKAFKDNGGKINTQDEYTLKNNVYKDKAHHDARRNIAEYKHGHLAEVDHIVPLKDIHNQLKGNYALTDEDIKNIANKDSNYAITAARINRGEGASGKGGKFEKNNKDFVENQKEREASGKPNLGLSEEAKENMLKMGRDAQKAIDHDANKAITKNIVGNGTGNTKIIWDKNIKNAANQSKDQMVGNVILYLIKPLYYEISDIFSNGLEEGVGASSVLEAFGIRFGRMKKFIVENVLNFLGDNVWEFVKGFISSLIEGIISLFVGIFKQILKLIKEGIKIFVQIGKVLFGKQTKEMSMSEKGDAIIKLLGGSVVAICGIGIEALLNKIGIGEPWSIILSTMISGICSALFMVALDRIDLFSVKAEKRKARIDDIFNERIQDIKDAKSTFNTAAIETMRKQRLQFNTIRENIMNGINTNNIEIVNANLYSLASSMNVDLPYSNTQEFVAHFDSIDKIEL